MKHIESSPLSTSPQIKMIWVRVLSPWEYFICFEKAFLHVFRPTDNIFCQDSN